MNICLGRGADWHIAQLMPLPPTVSCFGKIQIGFTFLVLAHPRSPEQRAVKRVLLLLLLFMLFCVIISFGLLLSAVMSMYTGAKTVVRTVYGNSSSFEVKVGIYQGSALSPLLFVIVMKATSREFSIALPWELLYADDS